MAYTAGNVMDDAAVLLNDAGKSLYTYIVQLPYLRMAYRDMDQELTANGAELNLISEAEITIPANQIAVGLPASFFMPVSLQEKGPTETNDRYVTMEERRDISKLNAVVSSTLLYWDFRHNCVNLIGANVDRKVRMVYWRTLPTVIDETTQSEIRGGQNYLAFRTAALCARYIGGENGKSRSIDLNIEAQMAGLSLVGLYVKNTQGSRTRRKRFRVRTTLIR